MQWPNFQNQQFMDASGIGGLNPAFGAVTGAIASVGSGAWAAPGLLAPESMTLGFTGMVAGIGLPRPWGVVASSGTVVKAHGATTGQDTTNYTVNFAPLVPGGGSVTAYLAATITQIQQNPFGVPGPPTGDPAYDPSYIPTVGYATNLYSVALSAVTGGIDNVNTFELFRTTLTAGQVTLATVSTVGQVRAPDRKAWPASVLASGGVLTPAQAQSILLPGSAGLTHTLPLASTAGGLLFGFVNSSNGTWTIVTSGSDNIFGFAAPTGSISIVSSGSLTLWGNAGASGYEAIAASPNMVSPPFNGQGFTTAGSFNFTVPAGVTGIRVRTWGAGGGGGGAQNGGGASGGQGGGYAEGFYVVTPGQVIPLTIGAHGTGGSPGGNGTNGGDTTFGSPVVIRATGGSTGLGATTGVLSLSAGSRGTPTGGTIANLPGQIGTTGFPIGTYFGGAGGGAPCGGPGGAYATTTPWVGTSPGGGGGGGGGNGNNNGGDGADGTILIDW